MSESLRELQAQGWTKVITPRRGIVEIPWREVWHYRDLIMLMARRDLTANFKQTILGPLWFLIQPLVATFFFAFIFGGMARMGTDGQPALLFYFSGLALWSYLADCVSKATTTFTRSANVFGKVYFPRLVVPFATALSGLVNFAVQFSIFLLFLLYYWMRGHPVHPSWRVLLLPVMLVHLAMLGIGLGCIISSLSTRFRDLSLGAGFAIQLWMYASSVVFPLSRVSEDKRWFFMLNPVVPVVEGFRFSFLGFGVVERSDYLISFGVSFLIFIFGVLLFSHAEQTAMDNV